MAVRDTRGIIDPSAMLRTVDFDRFPAPPALDGLVDWFWCVRWRLGEGQSHSQHVLSHPCVNVSLGNPPPPGENPPPSPYATRAVVNGVPTGRSTRVLTGAGWNLAAKTTIGGFGAWVDDVAGLTDLAVPAADAIAGIDDDLAVRVAALTDRDAVARLAEALVRAVERRPARRVADARAVASSARAAERDRSVRTAGDLAALAGVTVRTLQRMYSSFVGISPTAVIRRFRLIDAAELVKAGQPVAWADVAAELGYSDQAHLTRDFTAALGVPPAAYARAQVDGQRRG